MMVATWTMASLWQTLKAEVAQEHDYATEHAMQPPPVPVGVQPLDEALGGGMPVGTFTVVGGEGGAGKSALAIGATHRAAMSGYAPVYFSLEMSHHMVVSRLLSVHTHEYGLPQVFWSTTRNVVRHNVADPIVTPEQAVWYAANFGERDPVLRAWRHINECGLWGRILVLDRAIGVEGMCNMIRELVNQGTPVMPIIDYVQLAAEGEKEYEAVTAASHALQACFKECGCPGIVVSSLRNVNQSERKEGPTISMLRGSGHLGYDAGTVIILTREGEDEEVTIDGRTTRRRPIMAHVLKNRVGPSGTRVPLYFYGGENRFE